MKSFKHVSAKTVKEAVRLLKNYEGRAKLNAGGTDLLGILKDKILPDYPETIINIKTIPNLDYISEDDSGIKIGPLAKLEDIAYSALVRENYKILAEAAAAVATPQIRGMGTIGGNLCQDVRCWYYRYPHHAGRRIICRRKGKGPCYAVKGENRYNAIMGAEKCFAVSPSDTATALSSLDARIKIDGTEGARVIPVNDFFTPMGNVLKEDEMVSEVRIPMPPANSRQNFIKFTERRPVDFAVVSVASVITVREMVCVDARIALGGVAPTPIRAAEAERILIGRPLNEKNAEEAADIAVSGAKPLSKNAYKIEITRTLIKRSILL